MSDEKCSTADETETPFVKYLTIWSLAVLFAAPVIVFFIHLGVDHFSGPDARFPYYVSQIAAQLGDSFGAVNAIVSACAFVAIVISILQQQHDIRQQRRDFNQTADIFKQQKNEQKELNSLTRFSARQQAVEFINHCQTLNHEFVSRLCDNAATTSELDMRQYITRLHHIVYTGKMMADIPRKEGEAQLELVSIDPPQLHVAWIVYTTRVFGIIEEQVKRMAGTIVKNQSTVEKVTSDESGPMRILFDTRDSYRNMIEYISGLSESDISSTSDETSEKVVSFLKNGETISEYIKNVDRLDSFLKRSESLRIECQDFITSIRE